MGKSESSADEVAAEEVGAAGVPEVTPPPTGPPAEDDGRAKKPSFAFPCFPQRSTFAVWGTGHRRRGNRFPGCGGTGSPSHPNRFLFLTVRTPKANLVGKKLQELCNSKRLVAYRFGPGLPSI